MTALSQLLDTYRTNAQSEREQGTYFEDLILCYLRHEASYRDLYRQVWRYAEWAELRQLDKRDTGIDLVAETATGDVHAIQCKLYAEDHKLQKSEIDSFFTASGKKPFVHRLIVSTCLDWTEHAEDALRDQQPPVSKIDLHDLENSQIDWSRYQAQAAPVLKAKKQLRDHQNQAVMGAKGGLKTADRGKLIMACGTGKTFTALKIAETVAGAGGRVLFLVPSLSLLSQTLTEWTQESEIPLHSFAVCSDSDVGKKRKKDDDIVQTFTHELRYPATTEAGRLAVEMQKRHDDRHLSVVFSTYHSINVVSRAQQQHGLADFELIICDEAHRTTGVTFEGDDESSFVKVHDADFIKAKKRLYMTATPRIYGDVAKASAEKDNVALCSMDDGALYGQELFTLNFSEAVKRKLLVDYKVLVLAVEEAHISRRIQELLKDPDNQLKVDDAAKIIGCWKALSKQGLAEQLIGDGQPMRRAVAFCQVIERTQNSKTHKVSSKQIAGMFQAVVEAYQASEPAENPPLAKGGPGGISAANLICEAEHIDGGMNASQKEAKLQWLKAQPPEHTCRILSNVRCLSEGVDVPALDAVLFLTPRNSQVDVVQSVGRVMRNAPNKQRGYIILPVVIPAGIEPHEALNDNQTYKVVWQVLNALRSHDDRFDAMVNKLDLIGQDIRKMEVVAITDKIQKKAKTAKDKGQTSNQTAGRGGFSIGTPETKPQLTTQDDIQFEIGEIERAIYAKLVQKVGNRHHWEDWANDIAKIARTHIDRITGILENPANTQEIAVFHAFAQELRDDLNDSITDGEIIEMLAQHLITKPVFDALFEGYSFARHNPMSQAMQAVLDGLHEHHLDKEADTLQGFYDSVKLRAEGIDNAAGKQKIVVELYDKFFRGAFPKMTERLGIVYTPVEVVDFILHSVSHILKTEFGKTLGHEGVHILDPFTGTGTFITRLLQSGLISPEQLPHKYQHEIHANEIVLLAYYIAAINIESVYHDLMNLSVNGDPQTTSFRQGLPESNSQGCESRGIPESLGDNVCHPWLLDSGNPCRNDGSAYTPFPGICLTDTFQLHEKPDLVDSLTEANSARRKRQQALDIRVIIGNPPYSVGQTSANDNNANIAYPVLDERIRDTYAGRSKATNKNALYDSYIRAIRWASDRIKDCGVIGFVTNAGFIEANTADGLRLCLAEEFSNIYIFHLRGNARTSGELRRKEKDNVFGMGTRAPIAITLLVKNPNAQQQGQIVWHDIGDYLSREQKLEKISALTSIAGISETGGWQAITPDQHGDWLKQRDDSFGEFISLGDKKDKNAVVIFENYSRGVATSRDAWIYNFSKKTLADNMCRMIGFYNQEVERYKAACSELTKDKYPDVDDFINADATKISWNRSLKNDLGRFVNHIYDNTALVTGLYRPFTKSPVYFSKYMNDMVYQMPRIFPDSAAENVVICVTGNSAKEVSALITNCLPDIQMHFNGQCFPLYLYDQPEQPASPQTGLFSEPAHESGCHSGRDCRNPEHREVSTDNHPWPLDSGNPCRNDGHRLAEDTPAKAYTVKDGITDAGLAHFQAAYPGETLSKEDLFYYVYGLLHSPDYRERYADNLAKELPRIPAVKSAADFWAFSQAGRKLADWHLHYESVEPYPLTIDSHGKTLTDADYRVEKMKYGKLGKDKDLTTLHYNHKITLRGIPLAAYEYVVNGKPALDWVVERQGVKTDKASGIVNDANDWAVETMNNPRHPLELFQRVVTVSLETMKIVKALPKLEINPL